jgi:hypothetical protein
MRPPPLAPTDAWVTLTPRSNQTTGFITQRQSYISLARFKSYIYHINLTGEKQSPKLYPRGLLPGLRFRETNGAAWPASPYRIVGKGNPEIRA